MIGPGCRPGPQLCLDVFSPNNPQFWPAKQTAALGSKEKDVRAGLLNHVFGVPCVNHGNVQTAPLKHPHTKSECLCCSRQNTWIVADKDDASCWRERGFYKTDNIRDRQAAKQRPHGKLIQSAWWPV